MLQLPSHSGHQGIRPAETIWQQGLHLQHVSFSYWDEGDKATKQAVTDVSFSIHPGQVSLSVASCNPRSLIEAGQCVHVAPAWALWVGSFSVLAIF